MHLKRLYVGCLILSTIQMSMGYFSIVKWVKGKMNLKNSPQPKVNDNNILKATNASYDDDALIKETDKKDIKRAGYDYTESDFWEANQIPATCNEDAILLPLARLKIISPEKIIELLATPSLEYTCERVNKTIIQVNEGIAACPAFPENHLYKKLCEGLEYFASKVCMNVSDELKKHPKTKNALRRHWECYSQLRDDLYDCEGPPDWFEKKNRSAACQFYNDVIDCNYIKAAMLCGKEAAKELRDFSDGVLSKVLTFKCKISHPAPHVDVSLLSSSFRIQMYQANIFFILSTLLIFIL